MRKQGGLALVIVIWVLSLLMIMAGSFALTMRRETTVISAVKDQAELLAAAETGLAVAEQMLTLADENSRWRADGSIYQISYRDAEIRVRVLSEQGKIDINAANEELLRLLMQSMPLSFAEQQALVSAIIDWRDDDDLVYINGAEKQEYQEAGLSYGPANKAFQLLDELQLVLGMRNEIYQQLQPLVTLYSGQAQVNLQLASREVLQIVANLGQAELEAYLQQRIDNARLLLPPPPFPQSDGGETLRAAGNNGVYTVISQARIAGDDQAGIKTVITTAGAGQTSSFQILEWRQTYQEASLFSDDMEPLLVTVQDESGQQY
ncbi:type II secretion system protein GspK [Methylomarinum sp. Ch1-1]|uniref:Type II secretion system protein GspK n=1 Tax=Methylomarinum roseum TaxID=3067653 RepID=A0AAU7NVI8_9GAMM|nr:type II secretion system protein GspK [Methylomarinum sp. Ch1-1]MDP4522961.1 type II secretion system protein GspK [Methylomarinum sp. Ch1-1]